MASRRRFIWTSLGLMAPAGASARSLHISGPLAVADGGGDEGYFAVGQNVMVAVRPKSEEDVVLKAMVGREVTLSVF